MTHELPVTFKTGKTPDNGSKLNLPVADTAATYAG